MKTLLIWLVAILVMCALFGAWISQMPGDSYTGGLPVLTEDQQTLAENLQTHVETLSRDSGTRGPHQISALTDACDYLRGKLRHMGYDVKDQPYNSQGLTVLNLEASLIGTKRPEDIVVIGAHYDCEMGSPGADANASGCAAVLEIARGMGGRPCERTVRFCLFATGAGPLAGQDRSGAGHYAREARKHGEKIVAMLALDSLGTYRDTPGTQNVGFPLSLAYPDVANFVMFGGDLSSHGLVGTCVGEFRKSARFPCEGLAAPGFIGMLDPSDDAGFRDQDFPAIEVTDTGKQRSDKIGTAGDTSDKLDYARLARVTDGLMLGGGGLGQHTTLL